MVQWANKGLYQLRADRILPPWESEEPHCTRHVSRCSRLRGPASFKSWRSPLACIDVETPRTWPWLVCVRQIEILAENLTLSTTALQFSGCELGVPRSCSWVGIDVSSAARRHLPSFGTSDRVQGSTRPVTSSHRQLAPKQRQIDRLHSCHGLSTAQVRSAQPSSLSFLRY